MVKRFALMSPEVGLDRIEDSKSRGGRPRVYLKAGVVCSKSACDSFSLISDVGGATFSSSFFKARVWKSKAGVVDSSAP